MALSRSAPIAALLFASAAVAQTGGTPIETAPVPLPPEKQVIVRDHAQRQKMPEAQAGGSVTVGMTVPDEVELWSLPQDAGTEVPNVTSYKFFVTSGSIAVVDPDGRKVIQLIPN